MEKVKTPMDVSAASLIFDLEMEDYNLFPKECHMNYLLDVNHDEEFIFSHHIPSALQEKTLHQQKQSFTSDCISKTESNNFSTNPSTITEISKISPKLSNSSSISSFQSQILSFENPNSYQTTQIYGSNPKQNETFFPSSVSLSQLRNMHFSNQNPKGYSKNQNLRTKTSQCNDNKRFRSQAQDHIIAERKRRKELSQSVIALAALVPGLKKMDKASVLAEATKYVKELKHRLSVLEEEEEQNKNSTIMKVSVLNKQEIWCYDYYDYDSCGDGRSNNESLFKVEARASGIEVLIQIHCKKQKGILVKILSEIQNFHLFVLRSSVLPFGDSIFDITISAQMGEGYNLNMKELVNNLRVATLKFMCTAQV